MKLEMKLINADEIIAGLQALPVEIVGKRGGPVRAALRKGALVILRQELANLEVVTRNRKTDEDRQNTGTLAKALIVTRGKALFGGNGERYLVRVKRTTYPGRDNVKTIQTAQLLEYGSSTQDAEPWVRPAVESRGAEAIRVIETELLASINRAVKRLLKMARA